MNWNIDGWIKRKRKLIAAIIVGILALSIANFLNLQTIGFIAGAQGLQAEFNSLYFNGTWCSAQEKPSWAQDASNWRFGFELNFDPDESDDGWPNLCATQQPFVIDTEVEPKHYAWQVDKGIVKLQNGTRVRKVYQFEIWRYRLEWAVNIWLSGSEDEAWDRAWHRGISWEPNYGGTEIWIKLVPRCFAYFEDNPDEVYFAPAYIGVDSHRIASIDEHNRVTYDDPDMTSCIDVLHKEHGETLGIYYERGGNSIDINRTLLSYHGVELDPEIFRNEYWIHIDLLQFKPWNHVHFWTKAHSHKWPSINLKFVVYVFVVGKWTIYFTEDEVPSLRPHQPPSLVRRPWSWWSSPWALLWTGIFGFFILLIVIAILAIFAPGALTALARAFSSLFKRRRKGG